MTDEPPEDPARTAAAEAERREFLVKLFGADIVEQAALVDSADLNMTDAMTAAIGDGVKQLKQLKPDTHAQHRWLEQQEPGLQLLLCLWVMDMDLLEKVR